MDAVLEAEVETIVDETGYAQAQAEMAEALANILTNEPHAPLIRCVEIHARGGRRFLPPTTRIWRTQDGKRRLYAKGGSFFQASEDVFVMMCSQFNALGYTVKFK